MAQAVDVVVVGAGPVGLLAAVELALGGVRVLVLERLAEPSATIKALGVGPLGAEALERRGMAEAVADAEARALAEMDRFRQGSGWGRPTTRVSGHFGLLFIPMDPQREPGRRMRAVDQQSLEAMLAGRADALGIEVRRGCDVTGFAEDADGIDVAWASPAGEGRVRCAYLVGCDGGRSAVRKRAGFAFPGTPPSLTMIQAVLDLDDPAGALRPGWHRTGSGVYAHGPFPRRLFLLDFAGPPADREAPVTGGEVEAMLRRISGADVRVAALETANRWTDNTRLVDGYRRGRVLLAGDAAHVHSPFGGQGLSLGLADAANLGWKLAAAVRGDAPEGLLDSYAAERRPVAEAVLANTLAQVAIMRPDPQSGAMRDVLERLLGLDDVVRLIGETMRGLATRYDFGSDRDEVGRLVGDRTIRGGGGGGEVPLYGLMQDGASVLLDASSGGRASALARTLTARVRCVPVHEGPSLLIRPDACVAWAGEGGGTDGLEEALRRWFVPAEPSPGRLAPSRRPADIAAGPGPLG